MKTIHLGVLAGALAGTFVLGAAQAQTGTTTSPSTPATPAPMVTTPPAAGGTTGAPTMGATGTTTGTTTARPMTPGTPGAGIVNRNTGPAAASGDTNQAVATTNANAPQPARGRNSFTQGEARRRIERNGYSQVAGLSKDAGGVWRGHAMKDGATVNVWLDYKGNVGQQ